MKLDKRRTSKFFTLPVALERINELIGTGDCYPLDVVLHLNNFCNHNCDFCYNIINVKDAELNKKLFLEKDYILNLFNEFSEIEVSTVILSGGGEPLLYKNINEILSSCIDKQFVTYMYTNLDSNIDSLVNLLSTIAGINLNINTSNPILYKKTRGPFADLTRVENNIELLVNGGANLAGTIIVRDNTVNTLEDTINWLLQKGISRINISPAFDLNYSDNVSVTNSSLNIMKNLKNTFGTFSGIRLLEKEGRSVKLSDNTVFCGTHFFDITIGADYGVYPCCNVSYLTNYKIMDLKNYSSFREAWRSQERKKWIENTAMKCKTCWFSYANNYLVDFLNK